MIQSKMLYCYSRVKTNLPEDAGNLPLRAFYRLRAVFRKHAPDVGAIYPSAKISRIFAYPERRYKLNAALKKAGFTSLPEFPAGLQFVFGTVGDLLPVIILRDNRFLRTPGTGWSRAQVRDVVRTVIRVQMNIKRFRDSDNLIKNIGID